MDKLKVVILVGLILLFCFGFKSKEATITECKSTVTKYVTAEFSELVTGIDFEGNFYTATDSWSDDASLKFTSVTIDGDLNSSNYNFNNTQSNGYYLPPMPKHDGNMSKTPNFDRFRYHNDSNLKVSIYSDGERDYFNDPIGFTEKCINKLQTAITVKNWYFISYGSEWD